MKYISPHVPVFKPNTMIYCVNLRIHSEYWEIWTKGYLKFRHFSRSGIYFISTGPFVPNALFLYPLKTSENRKVF